jgi:nucleoside-diphosphate-sugar epimerase
MSNILLVTGATGYLGTNLLNYLYINHLDYLRSFKTVYLLCRVQSKLNLEFYKAEHEAVLEQASDKKHVSKQIDIKNDKSKLDEQQQFQANLNDFNDVQQKEQLADSKKPENFELIVLNSDLQNFDFKVLGENKNLTLLHAAKSDFKTEQEFFNKLNEYARKQSLVTKINYLSSAAVYGDIQNDRNIPIKESISELKPMSDYGKDKLQAEQLLQEKFENTLIMRIANPYGKELTKAGFYQIIKQKLSENFSCEISLNSDYPGQIIRDFIYIDDCLRMISILISNQAKGIYNISSARGCTLENMVVQIAREIDPNLSELEIDLNLKYQGRKENEIISSVLDNSKFLEEYRNAVQEQNILL